MNAASDDDKALERVRDRLVSSPDDKLPQILCKLLPRLLSRFYHPRSRTPITPNPHLIGILEHLRDRILLNPERIIDQIWVDPLVQAIAKAPIEEPDETRSWIFLLRYTLPILELALPSLPNYLPAFLCLVEGIHHALPLLWNKNHEQENPPNQVVDDSVEVQQEVPTQTDSFNDDLEVVWKLSSWIVVEQISVASNLQPVLDWITVGDDWEHASDNLKKIREHEPTEEERLAAGNGVFHLLLDALSFDPSLGNDNTGLRWDFRRQTETIRANFELNQRRNVAHSIVRRAQFVPDDLERRVEVQNQLFQPLFQQLASHFPSRYFYPNPLRWRQAEISYWRGLQQCLQSYALKLFTDMPERENILRIVTGQPKPTPALELYKATKPSQMKHVDGRKRAKAIERKAKPSCSLTEQTALLHIILGSVHANQVLQKQPRETWRYLDLVGGSSIEHPLFAALRPLPSGLAQRAFSHVLNPGPDFVLSQEDCEGVLNLFSDLLHEVKTALSLQVPITTEVYLQIGAKTPPALCWSVRIFWNLLDRLFRGKQDIVSTDFPQALVKHGYEAAVELLGNLQDIALQRFEREQQLVTAYHDQRRLQEHRDVVANRHPFVAEALEARAKAYHMVARLVSTDVLVNEDVMCWDIAVIVLNCMAFDKSYRTEEALQIAAAKVLGIYQKVLADHAKHEETEERPLPPIHPLLLPLLKACISASDWCREMVVDWTEHLVSKVDFEISKTIFAFLVSDDVLSVSRKAAEALKRLSITGSNDVPTNETLHYLNLERRTDRSVVAADLQDRTLRLTERYRNVSNANAYRILQEVNFIVDNAVQAIVDGFEPVSSILIEDPVNENDMDVDTSEGCICPVCWDETSEEDGLMLRCGHYFCFDCYNGGLNAAASSGSFKDLANFTCLHHDCNETLGVEEVQVVAPRLVEPMESALLDNFIFTSLDYASCPGPDCSIVVHRSGNKTRQQVDCSHCNTSFCFDCGDDPHAPADCATRRQFIASCERIKAHEDAVEHKTIPCPSCGVLITKVSGCNHMTCVCGHEFCWICLSANWQNHVCNVYDTLNGVNDVRRILFFRRRVNAHFQSAELTRELLRDSDREVQELKSRSCLCKDVHLHILKEARKMIHQGRIYLANSYIAAYGFHASTDADIRREFETHQSQLQLFVEQLSFLCDSLPNVYRTHQEQDFLVRFRGLHFCTIAVTGYIQRVEACINRLMAES